ncbi:hypothetical protein IEO21_08139 [Rhodonia placenta]|uniref:Uncharacterized protein n=1 Tax=Rhodonia placenta TaxID=104341 RepID=A0A8H7NWT9_9APHY|nr:hypothetical protein IEO21_08139 [Postia placenta]
MSFGIANRSNQISFLPAPNRPDARPGTRFGPLRSAMIRAPSLWLDVQSYPWHGRAVSKCVDRGATLV